MFLTSLEFVFLLLPITCLSYHWANARLGYRYGALVLLAGNVLFLWYWNWFSVLWLFGLALINWLAGRRLRLGTSGQKWLLAAALALNIIQLGVFKYTAFFLCGVLGLAAPAFLSSWVVPIGLSFFTFQQIAYLVECSRKTVEDHCIVDFLIYSTFFPYILSGPIVLPQETLRQLTALRRTLPVSFSAEEAFCALSRFTYGLPKKILLANQMEVYVGKVFDGLRTADTISLWIGVFAFSLQIYFDFSGYSDMALGVGRLFGFPLPENFNSPYKAMDIDDFWRRWHISLTRFLKQYVYIPLGGNRCSS